MREGRLRSATVCATIMNLQKRELFGDAWQRLRHGRGLFSFVTVSKSGQGGQSLVETALCLPIFLTLLMGMLDFSWYFFRQQTLTHAVREAGRLGQVGLTSYEGQSYASVQETVLAALEARSGGLLPSPDATVTFSNDTTAESNVGLANSTFTIRVDYPHTFVTPIASLVRLLSRDQSVTFAPEYTIAISSTFKSEKYNDDF